jgi:hypothetical protein
MHNMYDEEEVPNMKSMHVVEEKVPLSWPETAVVLPEGEEVLVLQGPAVTVPPEEEVPLKGEEVLAPPPIAVLP